MNHKVTTFTKNYIENQGNRNFKISELPNEMRFSCVQSMIIKGFNKDGNLDILGGGNRYTTEVETTRNDASIGFLALGDGDGSFKFQPFGKRGVFLRGDVKDLAELNSADEKILIVVGLNNEKNPILKY